MFVANPIVADITIIDSSRAFIQGKNIGATQLIALDEQGRETFNDQVTVLNPPGSVVTLQRGKAQSTLSCIDERCQTAPVVGDATEPFDTTLAQIAKSEAMKDHRRQIGFRRTLQHCKGRLLGSRPFSFARAALPIRVW